MPLHYARLDALRRVVLTADGEVTVDEWRAAVERQIAEGCWPYGLLYDARQRSNVHSTEEVRRIIDEVSSLIGQYGPRGPVAFVAAQPAAYGMARMYGILATDVPFTYEAFQDVDAAGRWLDEQLRRGGPS